MTPEPRESARAIARRAGSGALELGLRYGLGFLLNLAGLTLAARALGDAAFGTRFALPLLLVNLFQLLGLGVWGTIVRRPDEPGRALLATGFTLQLVLAGVAAALVASGVASACARHFEDPDAALACRAAALGGLWTCLRSYASALAERRMRYRLVGAAEVLDLAVFNGLVVAGALAGAAQVAVWIAFATRGLPAALLLLLRERPPLALQLEPGAIRVYRSFGVPFLGFSLLQIAPVHAAPTVAAFALPAAQAALALSVLGLAYRILEFPRVLLTIAYRLALSAQSKLAGDPEAFARSLRAGVRLLMATLAPALAALALFAPFYLVPVFGPDFAGALPVLTWLAPAFLLNAAWFYLATAISGRGDARAALRYYALYNALLWPLVLLLVPRSPLLGLPFAELLAAPLGFLVLRGIRPGPATGPATRDVLVPVLWLAGALLAVAAVRAQAGPDAALSRLAPFVLWGWLALACGLRHRDLLRDLLRLARAP